MLAVILFVRGCASLALAGWIHFQSPPWNDLFRGVALYALIDGALGLATAALVKSIRSEDGPHLLTAMTFTDAIVRLALGAVLLLRPGITEVPMSAVPMFGAAGAIAGALGAIAIVTLIVAHIRHGHTLGYEAMFDPIAAVAMVSIGVGALLFLNPPATAERMRLYISAGGFVLGASFIISAVGAMTRVRTARYSSEKGG